MTHKRFHVFPDEAREHPMAHGDAELVEPTAARIFPMIPILGVFIFALVAVGGWWLYNQGRPTITIPPLEQLDLVAIWRISIGST